MVVVNKLPRSPSWLVGDASAVNLDSFPAAEDRNQVDHHAKLRRNFEVQACEFLLRLEPLRDYGRL